MTNGEGMSGTFDVYGNPLQFFQKIQYNVTKKKTDFCKRM